MMANGYLRISRWKDYQNKDIFKKSEGQPPWVKFYVKLLDDEDFEDLPYVAQLLFLKLLLIAAKKYNAIPNDSEWIAKRIGMKPQEVAKHVPLLLKGTWLSQTRSPRKSRTIRELVENDSRPEQSRSEESSENGSPRTVALAAVNGLPFEKELATASLMAWIGSDQDTGTRGVVNHYVEQMPVAVVRKVVESTRKAKPRNRARYVVGALKRELSEVAA